MSDISKGSKITLMLATLAVAVPTSVSAQQDMPESESDITVTGLPPADLSGLPEGPEIEGFISARDADRMQVTSDNGSNTAITVAEATQIRASKGFLGIGRSELGADSLLNGLPVTVETVEWGDNLVASKIKLRNNDLKTASMIRNGTAQGFAEQTAATEALRGRVGDIDKYNIKGTTNVNFDTGKAVLSAQDKAELCNTAAQAEAMENSLLLVVGYTDSTGDYEFNQQLSEKRASRVVNYMQQACGWKPYRMLTPTGMAKADPIASNDTPEGKAQNRRVAVNIMVSKSVDGI
ncbi:OmpA family protein [Parasphingorhabdus cellanae]|uniref:OmpA family protein n=1 Tax=Parasphingorhabdus cellanae TaxID=2806553 RepID=A0ABX7SZU8_9SPHN|nr:OmpA family protein [Parasphingorhabdus cellanae]QTD54811.1 OmpA family protein [Parasphingorhabdus cellanae]